MSFAWGRRSLAHRNKLAGGLVRVFDHALALSPFDLAITDSHRGERLQTEAFASGASKARWPHSLHNVVPSRAGHLDPFPIRYENWKLYYGLSTIVVIAASQLGIRLKWGGDWDGDFDYTDQTFNDLAHWELVEEVEV